MIIYSSKLNAVNEVQFAIDGFGQETYSFRFVIYSFVKFLGQFFINYWLFMRDEKTIRLETISV
jgi:hypothetical protein